MKKIYGKYFACSVGDEAVFLEGVNLLKAPSERFFCELKIYGVRPQNLYTANTAGISDKLDLIKYNLNNQEIIIGIVEFRMNAYLYYRFDKSDEQLIKNHSMTKEEYFKKFPID